MWASAALGVVGADALWLVPLGDRIVHGDLPGSIPYATAPSNGWHDVPAGGQVVFFAFYRAFGGDRGLVLAQALAAAVGLGALAHGLARQAARGAVLLVAALVVVGALPGFAVTNVSLFSLALFPVLLGLLESEADAPGRRIWLAVPLIAVWGNLHGAVLAGWALLACYLLVGRVRRRPAESAAVLAGATLALFANPELWQTPRYYWSVFGNEAARQGTGLWTPLRGRVFDLLLVAVFVLFAALASRRGLRLRAWEAVAVVGLAAATVHVARNGVWLLCVAAYPASRSLELRGPRVGTAALVAGALGVAAVAGIVEGPRHPGAAALAHRAARTGEPVLADSLLGQQVALAGGRVWLNNPLDAFARRDQRLYLAWLRGRPGGDGAVSHASLVLVEAGTSAARRARGDARLVQVASGGGGVLFRVRAEPS